MNPLIEFPQTPFGSLAFDQISPEHFKPAIDHWITVAKKRQEDIVSNSEPPTFSNTLEVLEFANLELEFVTSCFFNLNSAETNDEIQTIAREVSPILTAFSNETLLNEGLFKKIKFVWDNRSEEELTKEQSRLLQEVYEGFVRKGALLQGEDRERLKELSKALSMNALEFGEHVLKDTQSFEYHTEDESDLAGLSKADIESAQLRAQSQGKKGYSLGLDMPTYMSVMKYAEKESLRKHFFISFGSRGAQPNENNNEQVIKTLVNSRMELAQLLGFENHAALTLSKRMAKSEEKVLSFLEDLLQVAKPAAQRDKEEVERYALENGATEFNPWDFSFWAEKLKAHKFNFNDELLKPYFSLNRVLDGAFQVSNKLYGLQFNKRDDVAVYHEDVTVYEVLDRNGSFISLLYTDFFPRDGKRAGAWMTSFRGQYVKDKNEVRPHISIVCNFTKPTSTSPALLTFGEVTTLFHEFGHALHGILARGTYPSLTGTNVYWDFVELPSQIMENWCFRPEALSLFAKHYQTGEIIPEEFVERIQKAQTFLEGYATLRQLNFGYLDMAWHTLKEPFVSSVEEFEERATSATSIFPKIETTLSSTAFSHIFQGGYSAGYYSYKWAEVLDADAFSYFEELGVFNPEVAQKFEILLSSGGTVAPEELYRNFRGREPKVDALLKRAGLSH